MKKLTSVLVLATTIFNTSCSYAGTSQSNQFGGNMNMINLQDTKTWCLGRYTFEASKDAQFFLQRDEYDSFKIETKKLGATKNDLEKEIAKIIKEYTNYGSILVDQTAEVYHDRALTKIIWAKLSPKSPTIEVFAFVLDNGSLFKIEGSYSREYEAKSKESIENLVQKLKYRNNDSIPTSKGFCINNGFIKDNGERYRYADQTLILNFTQFLSVNIEIQTETIREFDGGLIARTTKNLKEDGLLAGFLTKVKTIRKGKRIINGFAGEEWITEAPMKGRNGVDVVWEYPGIENNNLAPVFYLSLTNGNDLKTKTASISNVEALKLYENILKSIKYF
ncbi:T6SS immunity protein Tli4 family protein [Acinetobacter gerneri]|uniref:T6SS immunity protein Tli4 family protein n=1 Tax=Acinetobacter gerneri TaxID=202952 RepID=UPI0028A8FF0C|nr:T6SS immunity protein Tli4 family protein [Acinetobacter gerneri]